MANKTIHTLITKFFGNDLPDAIQMSFRKWFVGGTHQQEKEEAARQRAAERRTRQVENVLGSVLRTAGREITRSIFGTRKR